ncbi:MAG TPA: transposase [Rhodanobacteraceae bacterium]
MTCQAQDSEGLSAVELIAAHGLEALPQAMAALINEAMRVEREHHLGAAAYERSEERCGYANGYKARTLTTGTGDTRQTRFAHAVANPGADANGAERAEHAE